ncbi:hypothetical protein IE53DRAFT_208231 [Violaceomyces palustris]|uniref:Uncharacterized protein n=1 Tax=Violaceomyces palustris TaxID=1673888 RepID=A0ACD0NQX0_9BASI|nr:hypothetical protein IE53DRAFT_208231 [Violaceomyces palustris]
MERPSFFWGWLSVGGFVSPSSPSLVSVFFFCVKEEGGGEGARCPSRSQSFTMVSNRRVGVAHKASFLLFPSSSSSSSPSFFRNDTNPSEDVRRALLDCLGLRMGVGFDPKVAAAHNPPLHMVKITSRITSKGPPGGWGGGRWFG